MKRDAVFLADCHIDSEEGAAALADFLAWAAAAAPRLYLLGDIFDMFIGDDDDAPFAAKTAAAMRSAADAGAEVFFQRGNHDFLVGEDFCRRAGAQLLPEEFTLETAGARLLLSHGDTLVKDDDDYLRFRARIRAPQVIAGFLQKPLAERRAMAQSLGHDAGYAGARRLEINEDKARALLEKNGCDTLLHGHIHRAEEEDLGGGARRFSLPAWKNEGGFISLVGGALRFEKRGE